MAGKSEPKTIDKQNDEQNVETPNPGYRTSLKRLLGCRWLVLLIGGTVLVHGVGIAYYALRGPRNGELSSPEASLGNFEFLGRNLPGNRINRAGFQLHLSLLDDMDRTARILLAAHQFKVQQDVEVLLRQSHSADFEDPNLTERKRQLQETINKTLGQRVIADVIITDLEIERIAASEEKTATAKTPDAATPDWPEKASG